jgi:NADH-quinone oxidoreductase subunit K
MVGPTHYLVLAAILFALGAAGVVLRRNAIIVLMSIELMLNAVNLTFLTFSRFPLIPGPPDRIGAQMMHGHAAVFFVIAVAAAEAAVGLAIVIAAFRSRSSVNVDDFDSLRN